MYERKRNILIVIIISAALFSALFILQNQTKIGTSVISNIMVVTGSIVCYWAIRKDKEARALAGFQRGDLRMIITVLFFMTLVMTSIVWYFNPLFTQYIADSNWASEINWQWLLVVIVVYLMVSIPLQEFIFRGYIQAVFTLIFKNTAWAVIATSALYALCHMQYGWPLVAVTFGFGLVLGYLMVYHKRLLMPILAHLVGGLSLFYYYFILTVI